VSKTIECFELNVSDDVLEDLQRRLVATRFPDQVEGAGWDYGTDVGYLRDLVGYWRDSFDWRAQEARINAFDNFTTSIDGQRIHFIHQRSKHANAKPLLIAHGWPGTIVEFLGIIGPLTDPEAYGGKAEDAFHVITPSLPGYGFSEPTRTRGWDCLRMGDAYAALMDRLGYDQYFIQGGDWGAIVCLEMAIRHADHVTAMHTNMPMMLPHEIDDTLSDGEKADLADIDTWNRDEAGYQAIQGSKPQSIGVALNDSPAGLAAWIIEKFRTWSDCDGDVESVFSRDDLLANITVYWVTQTITSSARLYYEAFKGGRASWITERVEVPTGVARFPKEIYRYPRSWVEQHFNLTHWTDMPVGGHFAAMERSELFLEDVRKFFRGYR
jgi:microsomal epoxide hydrolase